MNERDPGPLRAIRREPVVGHVHRELRDAILDGRIGPGARLVETSLAESLGVSRTPVREAIQRLEADGLVRRLRSGGVIVEDTTAQQTEIIALREAVEIAAVRLACFRCTAEDATALLSLARGTLEMLPGLGSSESHALDRDFHLTLARSSRSRRVEKLVEEFYDLTRRELWPRVTDSFDRALLRRMHAQHLQIAEAVVARDPREGEQALRSHLGLIAEILGSADLHREAAEA